MKHMTAWWRRLIKLRVFLIPDGPSGDRARGNLYKPFMAECGRNFKVGTQAFIYEPGSLRAGNDVYIGFNSYIGRGPVFLADEVLIGNFVSITATNHEPKGGSYRFGGFTEAPIRIGRGTWVAAHACVLAGVSIGEGCLVAAGAVVTRPFPARTIIAGVPAQAIGATT